MSKIDIAQVITDKIISELEQGTAPWVKPWHESAEAYNPITGTIYRGMNQLWLGMMGMGRSNAWLTFKQASDAGLSVKKGSKGVPIIFWKPLSVTRKDSNGDEVQATLPLLKHYFVFNADDVEGATFSKQAGTLEGSIDSRVQSVIDRLQLANGVQVASAAYYQATKDLIGMPALSSFRSLADYHATLLHEAVHATGHQSRLDRKLANKFGSEAYAFEELIAELGAAMLCMKTGVDGQLQHASYIDSWLKVLKQDKNAIIKAASKAQAAMDYLVAEQAEEMPLAA
jgi:antirestriction protein ArdC